MLSQNLSLYNQYVNNQYVNNQYVKTLLLLTIVYVYVCIAEPLSNADTNGAEESVVVSEVSSFQRLNACKSGIYLDGKRCPV